MSGQTRTAQHVNALDDCLHVGINLSETPGALRRARARDAQPYGSTLGTGSGHPGSVWRTQIRTPFLAALYVKIDNEIGRTRYLGKRKYSEVL